MKKLIITLFYFCHFMMLVAKEIDNISYLDIEQGLSNNQIRGIAQDGRGFMWFATKDGLNRYNGYSFDVFRNRMGDSLSLVHNVLTAIAQDADHRIWAATRQGICFYNDTTNAFQQISYLPFLGKETSPLREVIRSIQVDKRGNMLVASECLGLLYCPRGQYLARQVPLVVNGKTILNYGIPSVCTTPNGDVWVFVQKLGLCKLSYDNMTLELVNDDVQLAVSMQADDKYVYIGSYRGLHQYDTERHILKEVFLHEFNQGVLTVNCLTWHTPNELWIGTAEEGIFIYDTKHKHVRPYLLLGQKGLSDFGYIYSIYVDGDSRIWIGTSISGILIIDPNKKKFQTIAPLQPEITKADRIAISAFMEDKQHNIYVGTENAGLYIWHSERGFYRHFLQNDNRQGSLSSNSITSILEDGERAIWIGTFNAGVNKYDTQSGRFEQYRCINPQNGLENKVIRHVYKDRNRNLWAATLRQGTLMGGLYRFSYQHKRFDLFDSRLSDFFALAEDRQGRLWGGSLTDLIQIDTIAKKHRFFPIKYTITSIYEDRSGQFWVGTEGGGLFLFDRDNFTVSRRYTTENGLCNNSVLAILEDEQGFLWMSTYNGLMKFEPMEEKFLYYYQSDGLQSNQFQLCAASPLASGAFVFGGIKGFNLFFPSEITAAKTVPPLHFTNVRVDGASYPFLKDPIVLPFNKATLTFQFAALEYSSPDKIQYTYYMEGFDKQWNYSGDNRTVNYNRMPEGSYILRIRCTNSEGVWLDGGTALHITILPPWYRSWWAYTLYLISLLTLVYAYMMYHTKQTRLQYEVKVSKLNALRKKAEYDAEVTRHEKDLIAFEQERLINEKEREINEKRIAFFTNISHEFRTPLTLIINPIKDLLSKVKEQDLMEELRVMYRSARRMLNLIDQLLLFRKVEAGHDQLHITKFNFYELCQEVYQYFAQQAAAKKINYQLIASISSIRALCITGDRQKLEIVLFNLVSNALKYTPHQGEVAIALTESDQELIVTVSDTGLGIPADEGNKLFERFYKVKEHRGCAKSGFGIGLYLSKQFVELHDGEISYASTVGLGSTFAVKLQKENIRLGNVASDVPQSSHSIQDAAALVEPNEIPDALIEQELIKKGKLKDELISDKKSLLVVDDDQDMRAYIKNIFRTYYNIYEAQDGNQGLEQVKEKLPDLIITDYKMEGLNGIAFCQHLKNDTTYANIPVILLTASTGKDIQLQSLESGADDFITKPFEKDYLVARVANLLQNRNYLQNYFYKEITLQSNTVVVSPEYKNFLDRGIEIVEQHLMDPEFGIQELAKEIGMSHSSLYKRVKSISGQSVSAFIRYIRLRKAAQLLLSTDCNVTEAAFQTGFNDPKYFGKQFNKLFNMPPSEFIKKHRSTFNRQFKFPKVDSS